MESTTSAHSRSVVTLLITIGLVMAGTAVLFYILKPEQTSSVYWLAMLDILVMEFIAGWAGISTFSVFCGKADAGPMPTATRISIGTTLVLFLVIGALLSLIFTIVSGHTHKLDTTFRIILLVKWLGLLVVVIAMRTIGREGVETRPAREISRKARINCINVLQRSLGDLKTMQLPASLATSRRRVADQLEMTCNQARSWISATPESEEISGKVEALVSTLDQKVSALRSSAAEQHEGLMTQIEKLSCDISFEIKNTDRRSVSGLS